jgi:phosphoglycerate kinase
MPAVAGMSMEKEVDALEGILADPKRPFVVVLGGAKVTDKIKVIDRFLDLADTVLVGGAMSTTFLKAKGLEVGASKVDDEGLGMAAEALKKAEGSRGKLVLPSDVLVADRMEDGAQTKAVAADAIPADWMALDIGPATAEDYRAYIAGAGTVFWNGPMGVFEIASFAEGTKAVAEAMAQCSGTTVAGGGDSVAALNKFRLAGNIDHVSMGGGASLEFIEGAELPGVVTLADK